MRFFLANSSSSITKALNFIVLFFSSGVDSLPLNICVSSLIASKINAVKSTKSTDKINKLIEE
jgi:hypothetical protein